MVEEKKKRKKKEEKKSKVKIDTKVAKMTKPKVEPCILSLTKIFPLNLT